MEEKFVSTDKLWDYQYLYSLLYDEAMVAWDYLEWNDLEYEAVSYIVSHYKVVTVKKLNDLIRFVIPENFDLWIN